MLSRTHKRLLRGAFLILLLVLPTGAILRVSESIDLRYLYGYFALISTITFTLYYSDKQRAKLSRWRISEKSLHLCELLGGWAAAYLAQLLFRHKTRKFKFQSLYWVIVGLYQFISFELISDWYLSKSLWAVIQPS